MRQRNAGLMNGNALRLGLFGANRASGRTYARLPERWDASWENNVSKSCRISLLKSCRGWSALGSVAHRHGLAEARVGYR